MIKRSLLIAATVALALGANGETLSPQQALQRATATETGARKAKATIQPTLSYTAKTLKGDAAVYVFNSANNNGFMLVSADDVAIPMLGYTDSGNFDPNNIPDPLRYWLEEYARQIAYAKEHKINTTEVGLTFPSDWKTIQPYIKTKWGQNVPFNRMTPVLNNKQCPTGCVATAMAQVMNYYRYPDIGQGKVSYSYYFTQTTKNTYSMYFDEEPFQWDKMLLSYEANTYTEEQANAVAYLMKACGYATEMGYFPSQSGTQTEKVATALVDYFKYDGGIDCKQRVPYTATDWNALVYEQLQNGPVIYAGNSSLGGHCFITDGYDGDGYFHFNWGWSGLCDGYYLLGALNPTAQGTGGFYGGYNFDQAIITGVKKPNGEAGPEPPVTMTIKGTLTGSIIGSTLNLNISGAEDPSVGNYSIKSIRPVWGLEITNINGSGSPTYVQVAGTGSETFTPGSFLQINTNPNFKMRAVLSSTLGDGTYKARLVVRPFGTNSDNAWIYCDIAPQNYDYVYVTKSGSTWTVQNFDVKRYEITKTEIITPLYYNNPFMIQFDMSNPYDVELTQSVVPALYLNGKRQYSGESWSLTLMPNQKETVKLNCTFQKENGASTPTTAKPLEMDLVVEDLESGKIYGTYGTVTMRRSGSSASLRALEIAINNAHETENIENLGLVYGISNFSNIGVTITIDATGGFVGSPLTAVINEYDPSTRQPLGTVMEQEFPNMVYLETGQSATESANLKFEDYDLGKMYQLTVYYTKNSSRSRLASALFAASSGVEEILAGEDGVAILYLGNTVKAVTNSGVTGLEVYDMAGKAVRSINGAELDITDLDNGIYMVRARDSRGNSATLKIAK